MGNTHPLFPLPHPGTGTGVGRDTPRPLGSVSKAASPLREETPRPRQGLPRVGSLTQQPALRAGAVPVPTGLTRDRVTEHSPDCQDQDRHDRDRERQPVGHSSVL